ncbi:gamma-glutamyl-gamma-aminobutyrate hydrolase family protein [Roseomonas elaeocarpi]|uniref:Gamma-glutamyl-gamma-aminobutyrate hydrolase family protein n=1 Tax=Roseomonas elaeocarpi TaxID=907779 RepID=A0ABV6JZ92_9PROT
MTALDAPVRPAIGLTLDAEDAGGWSKLPWYAIRQNYCEAVAAAGGLPVVLPHHAALAEDYLDRLDGLVVTGGAFDVDPALYGGGERHATVVLKSGRTAFELAVLRGALARDMPVLGICGGEQLLAVALGGTLIQHIPDSVPQALAHEQPNPRTEPGHEVAVVPGTLLSRITGGAARLSVNSAHHQAVATPGIGAVVSGTAPDGVVEAIEHAGFRFCLGVQWHPEYGVDPRDGDIFRAFVRACAEWREAAGQPAGSGQGSVGQGSAERGGVERVA